MLPQQIKFQQKMIKKQQTNVTPPVIQKLKKLKTKGICL